MSYRGYVSEGYYTDRYEGTVIPEDDQKKALIQASRHVDSLTYNRIVGQGFLNLTEFQQEIIKEVVCRQRLLGKTEETVKEISSGHFQMVLWLNSLRQ